MQTTPVIEMLMIPVIWFFAYAVTMFLEMVLR